MNNEERYFKDLEFTTNFLLFKNRITPKEYEIELLLSSIGTLSRLYRDWNTQIDIKAIPRVLDRVNQMYLLEVFVR